MSSSAGPLAAAGVIAGAPAFLRGQNLNNKLNIAFIACGGRASASLSELTITPGARRGRGPRRARSGAGAASRRERRRPLRREPERDRRRRRSGSRRRSRFNDLRRVFDSPNDFDAVVVVHGRAHARVRHLPGADARQARLLREAARLQHLGSAAHPRDAAKYPKLSTQMGNQGHASPARRTIKEILKTGVIGPVREVHVWADRAWGLQDAASAEKFDKPHGFYNGIQIVDRFKEEMPIPPHHPLGSVARPRAGAAVPRDVFPRPAVVPLVGFRQRHDERPRQPRQRRAVHGARHQAAADDRSLCRPMGRSPTRSSRRRR